MQAQKISDTEDEAETKALVDRLPYFLTTVGSKALVETVVVTLAKVKAKTLVDRKRVAR